MADFSNWWHTSQTGSDIITGLYCSGIFLFLLSLLKPKIRLCDKISIIYDKNTQRKNNIYYIKLVNKSIFFKIYDIQVRAWSTKIIPSANGDNTEYAAIKINKDYQWVMNRLLLKHLWQNFFWGERRLSDRTDYAAQFSSNDKLKELILSGDSITVEVIAKHSLTGFTRVTSKTYKHVNDIKKGHYLSGNSCRIV